MKRYNIDREKLIEILDKYSLKLEGNEITGHTFAWEDNVVWFDLSELEDSAIDKIRDYPNEIGCTATARVIAEILHEHFDEIFEEDIRDED